jgi:hypothetical protein
MEIHSADGTGVGARTSKNRFMEASFKAFVEVRAPSPVQSELICHARRGFRIQCSLVRKLHLAVLAAVSEINDQSNS